MPRSKPELAGLPRSLRDDVRLLGGLLGRVIAQHRGDGFVDRIETIRALAKRARAGRSADWNRLSAYLGALPEQMLTDIARAFNQFLNLANIADQRHAARQGTWPNSVGVDQLADVRVELVLTAHPTEVLRRTLIQKYDAIATLLEAREHLPRDERAHLEEQLERLIAEAWHTDEIRRERPGPEDEAKWGFAVIESSLWEAVPAAMRELDRRHGETLPHHLMPFAFASWMGGDRDGNPSVTAAVTRDVLLLARWMAADLFLRDVAALSASLSMSACTDAIRKLAGGAPEPYRAVLKALRDRLFDTRAWAEVGGPAGPSVILRDEDLCQPLQLCYESLTACGLDRIAHGPLLDTLRCARCFGVHLVNIDIRQHADRHTAVFDELTRYLYPDGERGYRAWSETERHRWLLEQLEHRRPLFPADWPASDDVREVIATCAAIAEYNGAGISAYVVSMACAPSDVLAVALLLKEARVTRELPIVPLFETLDDLDRAATTVDALLSIPWYRDYIHALDDGLQVMIGYSDSAKDAGQLAAAWAQYRAQEALTGVAAKHAVKLTLFHGRGGAVGRGGGPSAQAIESQPPGAVNGSFRVTGAGRDDPLQARHPRHRQGDAEPLSDRNLECRRRPAANAERRDARTHERTRRTFSGRLSRQRARRRIRRLLPGHNPRSRTRGARTRQPPGAAHARPRPRGPARHPLGIRLDPDPADAARLARRRERVRRIARRPRRLRETTPLALLRHAGGHAGDGARQGRFHPGAILLPTPDNACRASDGRRTVRAAGQTRRRSADFDRQDRVAQRRPGCA